MRLAADMITNAAIPASGIIRSEWHTETVGRTLIDKHVSQMALQTLDLPTMLDRGEMIPCGR
jgi:hypothetical protein